jgi:hypothetical protein
VFTAVPQAVHVATASLTVTPSFTAAGGAVRPRTASLTVTPSFTATSAVKTAASLTVTPVLSAAASGFAPWPGGPLFLAAEILLSGTWNNATSSLRGGSQVSVTRARSGEQAKAAPGIAKLSLDDDDGTWTPGGSGADATWGLQSPVRVFAPALGSYLRLDGPGGIPASPQYASTADNSALHVTGSLEARIMLQLTDWRPATLMARYGASGTPSWIWGILADGTLQWGWYDSGGTVHVAVSTAAVPFTRATLALRVTLNTTTGATTFYTSGDIDGTWTQLGSTVTSSATSVRAGDQPLTVGWSAYGGAQGQLLGQVYAARLYNGIGGTVVANPLFSAQNAGDTSWTDSASRSWSLTASEISGRDYRHFGTATVIQPEWPDDSGRSPLTVQVQSGGTLERLAPSGQPAWSAMRRYYEQLPAAKRPVILFPFEDGQQSAQLADVISGNPMPFSAGSITSSDDTSFVSCAPLAVFADLGATGIVPAYTPGATSSVSILANVTAVTLQNPFFSFVLSNGTVVLQVNVETDGRVRMLTSGGGTLDTGLFTLGSSVIGRPLAWRADLTVSGGVIQAKLTVIDASGTTASHGPVSTGVSGTTQVKDVSVNGTASLTWTGGFLGVQAAADDISVLAPVLAGHAGELAANRFSRLCTEGGIWPRVLGSPSSTEAMGPQPAATTLQLMQECEDADGGGIYEPRETSGLAYRTQASMTGQAAVVTATIDKLPGRGTRLKLAPKLDNSFTANDVTVVRQTAAGTGSSARSVLDDGSKMSISDPVDGGSGQWAASGPVNVNADSQLQAIADRRLARGTVPGTRFPQVPWALVLLDDGLRAALRALDWGDRFTVTGMPAGFADLDQLAWGFSEVFASRSPVDWDITVNTVPASPWS